MSRICFSTRRAHLGPLLPLFLLSATTALVPLLKAQKEAGEESSAATAPSSKAELAKLPYLQVAGMLREVNQIFQKAGVDFDMELRITSKRKEVKPEDIEVVVDNGETRTTVELGPQGLLTLPVKKDFFREDCYLLTDQPKGSLDLGMQFTFGKTDIKPSSTVDYVHLFKFMADLEKVAPDLGALLKKPIDLTRLKSVPYRLGAVVKDGAKGANSPARIVLKTRSGDQVLHADADGIIEIPWTKALTAENPKVLIPNASVVVANDALWTRLISASSSDR